jgi:hypothetical protein
MNPQDPSTQNQQGQQGQGIASTDQGVLAEIPPDRREFVKRMLVGAGMGLAVITSLYIPDVMAGKGRGSPNGYD